MLKHMPPGPPSGQPRPPTRGLHIRPPQPLNVSTLSNSINASNKNIANGVGPPRMTTTTNPLLNTAPATPTNISNNTLNNLTNNSSSNNNNNYSNCNNLNSTALNTKHRIGAREALTSLGLLCLVSLLLALLSLIFLLKISPGGRDLPPPPPGPTSPEDYIIVYDVTLALCALSLSLNLCCLLVCAIQFLFAVKLVRAPVTVGRGNKYLQKSSVSRVCAVGGFFISIPIFLTGIILYTFTQFHSTPAIITSVLIGIGIVFCGGAMVHNVFVWQKEKTICVRNQQPPLNLTQISAITPPLQFLNHINSNHMHCNGHINHSQMQHHGLHINHITPVTSPNHSHVSFNHHSYVPGYAMRAATATPPTPKIPIGSLSGGGGGGGGGGGPGRDATGSVSPSIPNNTNLDMSNGTNISPHELSTLV